MPRRKKILVALSFVKTFPDETTPAEYNEKVMIKKLPCRFCGRIFKAQQGLVVHTKCVHGFTEVSRLFPACGAEVVPTEVTGVMNDLVKEIEKNEKLEKQLQENGFPGRCGSRSRAQYSVLAKAEVIAEYEAGSSQESLAKKHKINRSLVSKWVKNRDKIKQVADTRHQNFYKIRPAKKRTKR